MAAAAYLTFGGLNTPATSTLTFTTLGANSVGAASTTESTVYFIARVAGSYSGLQTYITSNAAATVVLRFRKNSGDGNQLLSIGTGTGYFQDTSNTDVVAAGDTVDLSYSASTAGAVDWKIFAALLTPQGSAWSTRAGSCFAAGNSYTAAATDNLAPFFNRLQTGFTDTTSKTAVETAGTAKNLYANVLTNARTTTTNMRLWKNNAAGNLIIPYTSGQTGIKEDTSNTDAFAIGDTLQTAVSTAAADTNAIVVAGVFVDLTNSTSLVPYPQASQQTVNANLTRYSAIGGRTTFFTTTEAETQLKPGVAGIFQKSSIVVETNTVTATTNIRVRVGGNPGNNVRAIGSGVTGIVTDTSNTDTVTGTDLVNLQLITGATGTSMVFRNGCISFAATVTSPMYYYLNQLLTMGAAA